MKATIERPTGLAPSTLERQWHPAGATQRQSAPPWPPIRLPGASRWAPGALAALALVLLVWSLLVPLSQSLSSDEIAGVADYIRGGPAAIWGHYGVHDHMLFDLLSWALRGVTGDHGEPADRFWSVVPAIAAVAVLTRWLWRRIDPWVAALFAVLAVASPAFVDVSTQARGYGLACLAGALMLIGADTYAWRRTGRGLALFAAGGLIGLWTLPVYAPAFVAMAILLVIKVSPRRRLVMTLAGVALATLVFYAPVLGGVFGSAGRHFGSKLPWSGFALGPTHQLESTVRLLVSGTSGWAADVVAGVVLVASVLVAGLVRKERFLVLAAVWPAMFAYGVLEAARFHVHHRSLTFLLLPLLVVCALGLVTTARFVMRTRALAFVAAVCAIGLSLFSLHRAEHYTRGLAAAPAENFKAAAALVRAAAIHPTFSTTAPGFRFYLPHFPLATGSPAQLARAFCVQRRPFAFLEPDRPAHAIDTSCLTLRGAVRIVLPQREFGHTAVWFIAGRGPVAQGR